MLYFVFAGLDLRVWRLVKSFHTSVTSSEIPQVRYSLLSVCGRRLTAVLLVFDRPLVVKYKHYSSDHKPASLCSVFFSKSSKCFLFFLHSHTLTMLKKPSAVRLVIFRDQTSDLAAVGSPIGCRGPSSPESHFLWKTGNLTHELPFHKPNPLVHWSSCLLVHDKPSSSEWSVFLVWGE